MTTAFSQIFGEHVLETLDLAPAPEIPDWFDESAYLEAHPDVAAALERAELQSGYHHYISKGWKEKRNLYPVGKEPRGRLLQTRSTYDVNPPAATNVRASVEAVLVS